MKPYRIFLNWDDAILVVRQRHGRLLRSNDGRWIFTPNSKHPFDLLSDREQRRVSVYGTYFNGKPCSFDEIRSTHWNYFEEAVERIIAGQHPDENAESGGDGRISDGLLDDSDLADQEYLLKDRAADIASITDYADDVWEDWRSDWQPDKEG